MKQNPPIDDLPVEDVATIQAWIDYLKSDDASSDMVSITIRLSDGETLYTIRKDAPEMTEEETADEYLDRLVKEATPAWQGVDPLDDLPVEDVATIQAWIDYLKSDDASSDMVSITIRLSDGETLYTIRKDAPEMTEEETAAAK